MASGAKKGSEAASRPKLYGVKIYNYVNMSKAKIFKVKLENKLRDVTKEETAPYERSIGERNQRRKSQIKKC